MPIGSASAQVKITAARETTMVSARRSPMTSRHRTRPFHRHPEVALQDEAHPLGILDSDRLVEAELLAQRVRLACETALPDADMDAMYDVT